MQTHFAKKKGRSITTAFAQPVTSTQKDARRLPPVTKLLMVRHQVKQAGTQTRVTRSQEFPLGLTLNWFQNVACIFRTRNVPVSFFLNFISYEVIV